MRILIISPMPPLVGGVAVSSGRLFDNLRADGYDVCSYNVKLDGRFWTSPVGIALRFFAIPFWILFHGRFDVIHCHVAGTMRKVYLSIMRPLYKGARLVYTLHGDITGLLNPYALRALSKADNIICVQPGDTARLPQDLQVKSADIPAFIIPHTIAEDEVPTNILEFVKNSDIPVMLYYGGVTFIDGFPDLYGIKDVIELYRDLKRCGERVRLLMLVGVKDKRAHADLIDEMHAFAKSEADVLLVENARMPMLPLFRYAQVYVRPSKTDGDSMAVREALSMGCPTVASDKAVRPDGCMVYHNVAEFAEMTIQCLHGKGLSCPQPDFYEQIKQVYLNN